MAKKKTLKDSLLEIFPEHRWELIESALIDASAILSEDFGDLELADGDIFTWLEEVRAKIDKSIGPNLSALTPKEASQLLRKIDAINFLALLMQFVEDPGSTNIDLVFLLGHATGRLSFQSKAPLGAHQAVTNEAKRMAGLTLLNRNKQEAGKQLKQEAEAAIEAAMTEHAERKHETHFIKQ